MGTTRKILMAVVLVGALATASGSGTFAGFNATTTNASSAFQTGTVVLSNLKQGGTTCFSYGASPTAIGTNSQACADNLYSFAANQKPSASNIGTVNLTLTNIGSLPGTLKVYASTACSSGPDAGSYHGNGNLCQFLKISIQETTSLGGAGNGACIYPAAASNCAAVAAGDLSTLNDLASALSVGTLAATNGVRYFTVNVALPNGTSGAENSIMGLTASWALGWVLEQQ